MYIVYTVYSVQSRVNRTKYTIHYTVYNVHCTGLRTADIDTLGNYNKLIMLRRHVLQPHLADLQKLARDTRTKEYL